MELVTGVGWAFLPASPCWPFPPSRFSGSQWGEAVDPARWLALACALGIRRRSAVQPLIATGAADTLKITFVSTCCTWIATFVGASVNWWY